MVKMRLVGGIQMSFELVGNTDLQVIATRDRTTLWSETVSAVGEFPGMAPMPFIAGHRVVDDELRIQVDLIHPKGSSMGQLELAFGANGHLWTR